LGKLYEVECEASKRSELAGETGENDESPEKKIKLNKDKSINNYKEA